MGPGAAVDQPAPDADRRLRVSRSYLLIALAAALAFGSFSLLIRIEGPDGARWETRVSDELADRRNERPIHDSTRLSHYAADWRSLVAIAAALAAIALIAGAYRAAFILGTSVAVTVFVPLLKPVFARPPPSIGGDLYSFPSGHAVATMALGTALVVVLPRWWMRLLVLPLAAAFVAAIGVAVVAEQGHWPSDVLAGWALGLAWVAILASVVRPALSAD